MRIYQCVYRIQTDAHTVLKIALAVNHLKMHVQTMKCALQ